MTIFTYSDYRSFFKAYLASLPKKGRGELSKVAQAIGVHSTLLSLILSGERDFSLDQVFDLAQYLELTDLEREYLFLLVQKERAGNARFKSFLKEKVKAAQTEALKIENRFEHEKRLSDEARAIFYSSWIFSAV